MTLIYQSYQSISFFLFGGIFQPSKLHLFVGNFKNNRIEILPGKNAKFNIQLMNLSTILISLHFPEKAIMNMILQMPSPIA